MAVAIDTIPPHSGELVRGLLTVGEAGPNTTSRNWFRLSESLGSFSDDSDIEISVGLGSINRILWRTDNQLRLFRDSAGSFATAIAAGGDLAGKSFFIATSDAPTIARFDVGDAAVSAVTNHVRLVSDATVQAAFDAVEAGGLVGVVIADTPGGGSVDVDTGPAEAEAGLPDLAATAHAVSVSHPHHDRDATAAAGVPSLTAAAAVVAGDPVDRDTAAAATAGAPGLTASAEAVGVQPPSDVGGDVAAGAPEVDATAQVVPVPSATNLQTCRMLSGAWMPRRARVAVMPILATVEGPAEDLVRAICREICKELTYYTYGESCVPSDSAPTGTIGPSAGEHTPGAIVVSLDPNQSEPEFEQGSWEPSVSEVRLLVSQATTTDFDDLELFISRRADLRRVLSRLTGGIGQ